MKGLSSVPPLPPRRTQTPIVKTPVVNLSSVPPPPKQSKYINSKDLIHFSTICEQNSTQFSIYFN
jgi:hypothetical protein